MDTLPSGIPTPALPCGIPTPALTTYDSDEWVSVHDTPGLVTMLRELQESQPDQSFLYSHPVPPGAYDLPPAVSLLSASDETAAAESAETEYQTERRNQALVSSVWLPGALGRGSGTAAGASGVNSGGGGVNGASGVDGAFGVNSGGAGVNGTGVNGASGVNSGGGGVNGVGVDGASGVNSGDADGDHAPGAAREWASLAAHLAPRRLIVSLSNVFQLKRIYKLRLPRFLLSLSPSPSLTSSCFFTTNSSCLTP